MYRWNHLSRGKWKQRGSQ